MCCMCLLCLCVALGTSKWLKNARKKLAEVRILPLGSLSLSLCVCVCVFFSALIGIIIARVHAWYVTLMRADHDFTGGVRHTVRC